MRIILLGAPGSGKGTQSDILSEKFNMVKISTGDILRCEVKNNTDLGRSIKKTIDAGDLVSDEIMINLIRNRLKNKDCQNGFLLDGFPRTISQAKSLTENNILFDYVIEIYVEDKQIVKRIMGRRIHQKSGRTYHIDFNPPKKEGFDDITNEPLVRRYDDNYDVIVNRLEKYHKKTATLLDYYKKLSKNSNCSYIKINGDNSLQYVNDSIMKNINLNSEKN